MKWFDVNNLKAGDVICQCDTNDWISWVIRRRSGGVVNHIALYVDNGMIIDASLHGVRCRSLEELEGKYCLLWAVRMDLTDKELCGIIIDYCVKRVGAKYDILQLLGILVSLLLGSPRSFYDDKMSFVCSELIGEAFASVGRYFTGKRDPSCITPQDIFESDRVKLVE